MHKGSKFLDRVLIASVIALLAGALVGGSQRLAHLGDQNQDMLAAVSNQQEEIGAMQKQHIHDFNELRAAIIEQNSSTRSELEGVHNAILDNMVQLNKRAQRAITDQEREQAQRIVKALSDIQTLIVDRQQPLPSAKPDEHRHRELMDIHNRLDLVLTELHRMHVDYPR